MILRPKSDRCRRRWTGARAEDRAGAEAGALLLAEATRLIDLNTIWKPACGSGPMTREIKAAGYDRMA